MDSTIDDQHDGGLSSRLTKESLAEHRLLRLQRGETITEVYAGFPADFRKDLAIVLTTIQGLRQYDPR